VLAEERDAIEVERDLVGRDRAHTTHVLRHHEVRLERTALTVSALRRVKLPEAGALIRRLEIPHGRFVREITLSGPALRIADSHYLNGCLEVHLVRSQGSPE